jgi:HEAT repeat protein
MALHMIEADPALWGAVAPDLARLLRDPEPEVRVAAVGLIERHGTEGMIEPVLGLVADPEDFVREAAIDCLGAIGDARIVEPLLARAEQEGDPYLKIAIADRILEQGDERALGIYVDVMDRAAAPRARREAYDRLAASTGTDLSFDPDVPEGRNDDAVRPFREMIRPR